MWWSPSVCTLTSDHHRSQSGFPRLQGRIRYHIEVSFLLVFQNFKQNIKSEAVLCSRKAAATQGSFPCIHYYVIHKPMKHNNLFQPCTSVTPRRSCFRASWHAAFIIAIFPVTCFVRCFTQANLVMILSLRLHCLQKSCLQFCLNNILPSCIVSVVYCLWFTKRWLHFDGRFNDPLM